MPKGVLFGGLLTAWLVPPHPWATQLLLLQPPVQPAETHADGEWCLVDEAPEKVGCNVSDHTSHGFFCSDLDAWWRSNKRPAEISIALLVLDIVLALPGLYKVAVRCRCKARCAAAAAYGGRAIMAFLAIALRCCTRWCLRGLRVEMCPCCKAMHPDCSLVSGNHSCPKAPSSKGCPPAKAKAAPPPPKLGGKASGKAPPPKAVAKAKPPPFVKKLHSWPRQSMAAEGTIFRELQQTPRAQSHMFIRTEDMSMLHSVFSEPKVKKDNSRRDSFTIKPKGVCLLDNKRAHILGIIFRSCPVPFDKLCAALRSGNFSVGLTEEDIQMLLKVWPTEEEMRLVSAHKESAENLRDVERHVFEISKIPRCEARLRFMQLFISMNAFHKQLVDCVGKIRQACQQLHTSKQLRIIFVFALGLCNYINHGESPEMWARSFCIEALFELKKFKGTGGLSALHCLCVACTRHDVSFCDSLLRELQSVPQAARVSTRMLQEQMVLLERQLLEAAHELSRHRALYDEPVSPVAGASPMELPRPELGSENRATDVVLDLVTLDPDAPPDRYYIGDLEEFSEEIADLRTGISMGLGPLRISGFDEDQNPACHSALRRLEALVSRGLVLTQCAKQELDAGLESANKTAAYLSNSLGGDPKDSKGVPGERFLTSMADFLASFKSAWDEVRTNERAWAQYLGPRDGCAIKRPRLSTGSNNGTRRSLGDRSLSG
mmetsp:Transcript_11660/g.22316  ORF Transcript_11660/g.22316 Transcript_11660/m.22316 type:complete len:716 (-) Transcript_11660:65-2212(-)